MSSSSPVSIPGLGPLPSFPGASPEASVAVPISVLTLLLDYVSDNGRKRVRMDKTVSAAPAVHEGRPQREAAQITTDRATLCRLLKRGPVGIAWLEERSGIARRYLVQDLEALRNKGIVDKRGARRDAEYFLAPSR